jgi:N-acylneuraminate cytidylyltransferase
MPAVLVVIPARGGSKRVPGKNMVPLGGRPLLQYTLEQVRAAGLRASTVVSTDHPGIADLTTQSGIRALLRPSALAADAASTELVLLHALDTLEVEGSVYEWVLTLPPTNPFRFPATIKRFLDAAASLPPSHPSLMAVTENLKDFWRTAPGETVERLFPDAPRSQRGRKEEGYVLWEETSALYLTRVRAFRDACRRGEKAPIVTPPVRAIPIDPFEAFDINTPFDVAVAEAMLASAAFTPGGERSP